MFVNFFNYSVEQFDLLTPVQASLILDQRENIQHDHYRFLQNEFRLSNYFTVVTTQGSKQIKKPSDLYKFPEEEIKRKVEPKSIIDNKADDKFIRSLLNMN